MSSSAEVQTMMVTLNEVTVGKLLSMRSSQGETVDSVISRIIANRTMARLEEPTLRVNGPELVPPPGAKYCCEVMGKRVHGTTLPKLFAKVVDTMNDVAPDSMQRFAKKESILSEVEFPGLMDTFQFLKESVVYAENEEPVPCGIQGSPYCAGAVRSQC